MLWLASVCTIMRRVAASQASCRRRRRHRNASPALPPERPPSSTGLCRTSLVRLSCQLPANSPSRKIRHSDTEWKTLTGLLHILNTILDRTSLLIVHLLYKLQGIRTIDQPTETELIMGTPTVATVTQTVDKRMQRSAAA